jgi:hypothetical protein
MATTVSKPFYSSLVRHGEDHHEVTLVTNDLTASCEAGWFSGCVPRSIRVGGYGRTGTCSVTVRHGCRGVVPDLHLLRRFLHPAPVRAGGAHAGLPSS